MELPITDEQWAELRKLLQPGNKVREFYGEGNLNNRLIHIRSVVDEEYIVFKFWLKRRRVWRYVVEHVWYFIYRHKNGVFERRK